MNTFLTVLLIVLAVALAVVVVLYFVGRKMQSQQADQQALMDANKMIISMLIIDKKKMKIQDAGLPKVVEENMQGTVKMASKFVKYPVVKAKVGPKIMTLLADPQVFDMLPLKTECKVAVSGIYITELKSIRGQALPKPPQKKSLLSRITKKG